MSIKKGCPSCDSTDRLYSVEKVIVEYPVEIVDGQLEYTGERSHTFDESNYDYRPGFVTFHCHSCSAEWDAPRNDHSQVVDLRKV